MWELDCKESWTQNWSFWTVVLENTLEGPLDCKEIKPVHPEGDQSWLFIGRTDVEAETPIFWPPDAKELTHLKRPWCWERFRAGGEEDDRGWGGWNGITDSWWAWVISGSWWWTGRPGVLQSMRLQTVGHDYETELNWTELSYLGPANLKKAYSVLSHPEFPQGSLTRQLYYDSFTTTTSFVYWCGRQ